MQLPRGFQMINELNDVMNDADSSWEPVTNEELKELGLTDNEAELLQVLGDPPKTISVTNSMPNHHKSDLTSRGRLAGLKHIIGHPVPDDFDPYEISWVNDNIAVTSAEGAHEAIKQGLFVINTAGEISNEANVKLDVDPGGGTVLQTLQKGVELMKGLIDSNQRVVVHCSMGMERSVLMVAWYLIRYEGMTFDTAYALVRSARPIATDRRRWITA